MPTRIVMATATALGLALVTAGCQTHNYAQRGAALGGATGGGVGALLGEAAADKPLVGAVVGSAVGAMTGASVGGALDEVDARHQQRVDHALYAQEANSTSLQEIIAMSRSGLSDQVIERHIRSQGFSRHLGAHDLIQLRDQNVSDDVIAALQDAAANPSRIAPATAYIPSGPPVVVEEHIYAPPLPFRPHWRYHHHWPRRHHPAHRGVHWGISFGH